MNDRSGNEGSHGDEGCRATDLDTITVQPVARREYRSAARRRKTLSRADWTATCIRAAKLADRLPRSNKAIQRE